MKWDKNAVNALLGMSDDRLRLVIRTLAARAGVDAASLPLTQSELAALRQALGSATEEDITRLAAQFGLQGGI